MNRTARMFSGKTQGIAFELLQRASPLASLLVPLLVPLLVIEGHADADLTPRSTAAKATHDPPAAPRPTATFKKHPYLQGLEATRVAVRFEVDPAVSARIDVAGEQLSAKDDARTFHELDLTGLKPGTTYKAHVTAGTAEEDMTFTTAPDATAAPDAGADSGTTSSAPLSFLVYGDNRTDDASHAAVVKSMLGARGDFLVNTGDLVEDGSDGEMWQRFFDVEAPLLRDRCLFAAVGNHELLEESGTNFLRYFGEPAWTGTAGGADGGAFRAGPHALFRTMRWGAARFFFLNGMDTFTSGEEREWLDKTFTAADHEPRLQWRIVVVHFGAWSSGPHGPNPRLFAAGVPDLWRAHHVDLVLSGHDHIYERGAARGMKYVVSGGGGAPLYRIHQVDDTAARAESVLHYIEAKIGGKRFSMVVHRADGSILESCGFEQESGGSGPWSCGSTNDDPKLAAVSSASPSGSSAPSSAREPDSTAKTAPSRCACDLVGHSRGDGPVLLGLLFLASSATTRRSRRRR